MKSPFPTRVRTLLSVLLVCSSLGACKTFAGRQVKIKLNTVFVLGTLHGEHLTQETYTLERIGEIIRRVDPEIVLVEIPPDRYDLAWQEFLYSGEVQEERVKLYPEFTEILFPIALEGRFRVVPCSAWTASMARRRQSLLKQWQSTRPVDSKEVDAAQLRAEKQLEEQGLANDPRLIHTAAYDAIVAEGMEPYERIFSEDLGSGGWTQINLAHQRRIDEALDDISGDGRRVLVIFGAWHKYRLRELLAKRDDIELKRISTLMEP